MCFLWGTEFLIKYRTMDNVQNCDNYINIPSSQTYRHCFIEHNTGHWLCDTQDVSTVRCSHSGLFRSVCEYGHTVWTWDKRAFRLERMKVGQWPVQSSNPGLAVLQFIAPNTCVAYRLSIVFTAWLKGGGLLGQAEELPRLTFPQCDSFNKINGFFVSMVLVYEEM
jgi:hypothetical protein